MFVLGDGMLVDLCRRCFGFWVRLCHLHESGHWGVPSCMSLVDAGCCPEDSGSVGLPDDVMPVSTLLGVYVFTFCGGVLSTLGSCALSTLCHGLLDRISCNCLMI